MKITQIHVENYKTYRSLSIDLNVTDERPIILIGGCNGCGKTTLFDAIYHALYGWGKNELSATEFCEILNDGVKVEKGIEGNDIVFEILFTGIVLGREASYKLKRVYRMEQGNVKWSIELDMNGSRFAYGCASTASQRAQQEEVVNKIIAANLPRELSNYFLFDAMKTSELVKEEQINKLIMKNIDSVMGLKKYGEMRRVAETLLDEKKAEKLENENQRKEYGKLVAQLREMEEEIDKLDAEYAEKLEYANMHAEEYNQLKEGRNADETTHDKMRRIEEGLENTLKLEQEYAKDIDALSKDIETKVVFPKLASLLRTEIEVIVHAKEMSASSRANLLTDEQIKSFAKTLVKLIEERYHTQEKVDVEDLVEEVKRRQEQENRVDDKYAFLSAKDIDRLKNLVNASLGNPFILLDEQRNRLNLEIKDMGKQRQLLTDYRRMLSGMNYELIDKYDRNTKEISEWKNKITSKKAEKDALQKKISTYDYDMPQIPDPQYDLLCKLPNFFKDLSENLLRSKKSSIERMMCEQLNRNLVVYAGVIGRVELSAGNADDITFKIYHKQGNEIYLSQLNSGAKQTVMQVLLKVLYELGDYNPPVMIDTVMGVLDKTSRETILENYFPDLAHQTILLSTDTEITLENDFKRIQAYVAKTYTLHRDKENQCSTITEDYFGVKLLEI